MTLISRPLIDRPVCVIVSLGISSQDFDPPWQVSPLHRGTIHWSSMANLVTHPQSFNCGKPMETSQRAKPHTVS
ncbi:hypothetical protein RB2875 [Rhodopirellula baltica SH 1]|uniref:Uncharacterized protein n=1 Tax=Rhodopirellula baltica (strain DSM 10527 / NCIMB 13988 / SH1) TaxID=243090 RepID=Q7UV50_RHOBA|nr:hypothetical protein RB2875 [Rhodopirellula baltica SH 1]